MNAIIRAHKEQFGAIAWRPSLRSVFLVVTSTRIRELALDPMFHHALSSALSTVFNLAFAILPAAPLFGVKMFSSSAGPGPEQAQKKAASETSGVRTAQSA